MLEQAPVLLVVLHPIHRLAFLEALLVMHLPTLLRRMVRPTLLVLPIQLEARLLQAYLRHSRILLLLLHLLPIRQAHHLLPNLLVHGRRCRSSQLQRQLLKSEGRKGQRRREIVGA